MAGGGRDSLKKLKPPLNISVKAGTPKSKKKKPPLNNSVKAETPKSKKKKKEEVKEESAGMREMKMLMESWTAKKQGRKRNREEDDEIDGDVIKLPVADNVETVEPAETFVARVKRKFDRPGAALDPNLDFDSWKRRRVELQQVTVGHGQVDQGVGVDKGHLRERPSSVSEIGLQTQTKNITNHDCCSKSGGDVAGVQREGGGLGGGDGEVQTAQYKILQQRDRRKVGSFFGSGEAPDSTAAAVGKPVLMGESHSTNFAP